MEDQIKTESKETRALWLKKEGAWSISQSREKKRRLKQALRQAQKEKLKNVSSEVAHDLQ
jgi:hypothetical protein